MNTLVRITKDNALTSELKRLFRMQTNDEKIGKIKQFLKLDWVKKSLWKKEEYFRLLRLIESCASQFRSKDGKIEKQNIDTLIKNIPSIQSLKIQTVQTQEQRKIGRVLEQRR